MQTRGFVHNAVGYAIAMLASSAATASVVALNHFVKIPNISLLYLPVIVVTAMYFGTGPSLVAATGAVLEYDFFLLQPVFTFRVDQAQDALAFVVFAIVAVLTGQLAARARERAEAAQRRAEESSTLYELGQTLATVHEMRGVLDVITKRIVSVFGVDGCRIYVPDADGCLTLAAETSPGKSHYDHVPHAAALEAFRTGTLAMLRNTDTIPSARRRFIPLRTADRVVGVMEVGPEAEGRPADDDADRLVTSFAAQAAVAIERSQAEEERRRLVVLEESDRLKSALLSAVSHDLRTPLSSIKASATALLLADTGWTADERREFLEAIDQQADKLNRLVGNLLDLSRIEAGVLHPALDWYDMQEVVDTIVPHVRPLLAERHFHVDVQTTAPVRLDLARIEALITNLLENAIKYTPHDTSIELRVWEDVGSVRLAVVDHGRGVPERNREQIFNRFYRLHDHSDRDPGTGLGLAICRGVAEAHGGAIEVVDTPGGGATFVVTLPGTAVEERAAV